MAIAVYHNADFLDYDCKGDLTQINLARLYLAAVVATDHPEEAYLFTQHLDDDWYDNPPVTTIVHSRSTAVGDVLALDDGTLLAVASFGFTSISDALLPVEQSSLLRELRALNGLLATADTRPADFTSLAAKLRTLISQVALLYTALNFALPSLAYLAGTVDLDSDESPRQALLARFGREQAAWALAYVNRCEIGYSAAGQAQEGNELVLENERRVQAG
jgi:hypothetical protein